MRTENIIPTSVLQKMKDDGWSAEKKRMYAAQSYSSAACCYSLADGVNSPLPRNWMWEPSWWDPRADRLENLSLAVGYYDIAASIADEMGLHEMSNAASTQKSKCEQEITKIHCKDLRATQAYTALYVAIILILAFFVMKPLQLV